MLETTIGTLLWRIDPMGTGCTVNVDTEQEYARQAHDIAELLAQGIEPRAAVLRTFDAWFGDRSLLEPERRPALDAIVASLSAAT